MTEDGTLVYKKAEVAAVKEKALQVAAKKKDCVSFSPIRRTTNLMQLSVTLNTQDTSVALVLICHGNVIF
jgi:hypothetical protein